MRRISWILVIFIFKNIFNDKVLDKTFFLNFEASNLGGGLCAGATYLRGRLMCGGDLYVGFYGVFVHSYLILQVCCS